MWSSVGPDTPEQRWTRHASAILTDAPAGTPQGDQSPGGQAFDSTSIAALQQAWGVEGQPFAWTVTECTATAAGVRGQVELPAASESPAAALVDAAVHVARLADAANGQLLLPAGAESLCVAIESAGTHGVIEVFRRDGVADGLVLDVLVKGDDGETWVDIRGLNYAAVESAPAAASEDTASTDVEFIDWSSMTGPQTLAELRVRLRAILARELGMPDEAVDFDMAFPELGLDSMMAMNLLRDAKQLIRIDLSATMLWNHPSITQMSAFVAELLAPQQQATEEPEEDTDLDEGADSFGLLDELFDSIESSSVESANAGSEGAI